METTLLLSKSLVEIVTYLNKIRVRVDELHEKLQRTIVEDLRPRKLSAAIRFCEHVEQVIQKKSSYIETEIVRFRSIVERNPDARPELASLTAILSAFEVINDSLILQREIPARVEKEAKFQVRLRRAHGMLSGYRALVEDMNIRVSRDLVEHATYELVARLEGLNSVAKSLPSGLRRKELVDYKVALLNIGLYVRMAKAAHRLFCEVYKD